MSIPRPRLNLVELIAFGLVLAIVVGITSYRAGRMQTLRQLQPYLSGAGDELRPLEKRFGPARDSRQAEEWIIRDFFEDARDGVFADVGANHYRRDNNTYFLETQLGWSGVAVEPQLKFAADYATHRSRTRFIPLFVSDRSNEKTVLYVPSNDRIASTSQDFIAKEGGGDVTPVEVNTTTLDDVLTRAGLTKLDFVSIDVELHEPEVLRGFSIERWRPRLVCIESHFEVRQAIVDYFIARGYTIVGKYLRADSKNLWFAPRGLSTDRP